MQDEGVQPLFLLLFIC